MKTKVFILLALLLFITDTKANENLDQSKLTGTWVLVSSQDGNEPMQVVAEDSPLLYQKQFNGTHFCAITYDRKGVALRIVGGTYKLNGSQYYETIEFSNIKDLPNTKSTFVIEIKGNEMRITGTVADGMRKLSEVWKKLE